MKIIRYNPSVITKRTIKSRVKSVIRLLLSYLYQPVGYLAVLLTPLKRSDKKYKVSICAAFKNEALYLEEWLTYYTLIGADHFYLYNNNSTDNYKEVLEPFIADGIVTLTEWPGQYQQLAIFQDCYDKRKAETQWLGFVDIDEFVCMKNESNIYNVLCRYKRYPSLVLSWRMFGTSGIENIVDELPIIEKFTSCWESIVNVGKSFINTSYEFRPIVSPHFFWAKGIRNIVPIPPVNENKIFVLSWNHPFSMVYGKAKVWVNHYWSKSRESFFYKETVRGDALSRKNEELKEKNVKARFIYHEYKNVSEDRTIHKHLVELKSRLKRETEDI